MAEILAFIDVVSGTDNVLSAILLFFAFWIVPRNIWPWWKKQIEQKQLRDYNFQMGESAQREKEEERWLETVEKAFELNVEIKKELAVLNERIGQCRGFLQYLCDEDIKGDERRRMKGE